MHSLLGVETTNRKFIETVARPKELTPLMVEPFRLITLEAYSFRLILQQQQQTSTSIQKLRILRV